VIGEKEEDGRSPIIPYYSLTTASKQNKHYLFVLTNHQVQVFEIG